jgi:hypothetical protein
LPFRFAPFFSGVPGSWYWLVVASNFVSAAVTALELPPLEPPLEALAALALDEVPPDADALDPELDEPQPAIASAAAAATTIAPIPPWRRW